MGKLFGTDGIRGVANNYPLDAESAVMAGRAIAHHSKSVNAKKDVIVLGQDTRLSGDMISQAVGAGICSAGLDVSFLGVIPTPAVAFLTAQVGAAAGVIISASHNPYADNGIKVFDSDGYKLSDQAEFQIETLMQREPSEITRQTDPQGLGKIRPATNYRIRYLNFLQEAAPHLSLTGMTIVLDCANGATHHIAPELFRRLGANVIPISCTPNGININDQCGSQHPQAMAKSVIENRADLGFAFDGDGDRLIAADEKGAILSGDQIIAVCANYLKGEGLLKNNSVVSTIMSNMGFHLAMQDLGINLCTTQVGDRYVMQEMLARDAVLGGEDSGHIIFRDKHTTGDGILAAVRLLEAVKSSVQPLSRLAQIMTVYPQVLVNVNVQSKPDFDSIPEVSEIIKKVEIDLGERGRVLVRYSGTQPQCRVMVEGPTQEQTRAACHQIAAVVQKILG